MIKETTKLLFSQEASDKTTKRDSDIYHLAVVELLKEVTRVYRDAIVAIDYNIGGATVRTLCAGLQWEYVPGNNHKAIAVEFKDDRTPLFSVSLNSVYTLKEHEEMGLYLEIRPQEGIGAVYCIYFEGFSLETTTALLTDESGADIPVTVQLNHSKGKQIERVTDGQGGSYLKPVTPSKMFHVMNTATRHLHVFRTTSEPTDVELILSCKDGVTARVYLQVTYKPVVLQQLLFVKNRSFGKYFQNLDEKIVAWLVGNYIPLGMNGVFSDITHTEPYDKERDKDLPVVDWFENHKHTLNHRRCDVDIYHPPICLVYKSITVDAGVTSEDFSKVSDPETRSLLESLGVDLTAPVDWAQLAKDKVAQQEAEAEAEAAKYKPTKIDKFFNGCHRTLDFIGVVLGSDSSKKR